MTVINTNVKSLLAQNSLKVNNRSLTTAMEQLSTGKRINGAKDDAAGLAISSRMTSQIRGLNQAVRNANDGISLVQTAEGALIEVTNMLQRMRELAVQSSNDSNSANDRTALNLEFVQLREEIDRIGLNTQFNGFNLLRGTAGEDADGNVSFQVGANANQTIGVEIKDFSVGTTAKEASVWQLNLADVGTDDAADVTQAEITLGSYTFTVAITDAEDAEGTMEELQAAVNNISGYENVRFSSAGNVITMTDPSAREIVIELQDGDGLAIGNLASEEIEAGEPDGGELSALLSEDILTRSGADSAIAALDDALAFVNMERATMGATINRLSYAADNLTNVSQNAAESRSRILDADYAAATTELARTQIIQQAATAMLAQANQQPQSVLSLLQ